MKGFNDREIGEPPFKKGDRVLTFFYGYPLGMFVVDCIPYECLSQTGWKVIAKTIDEEKRLNADSFWFERL